MTTPTTKPRWYHLTPARFFIGLLVVQVLLFLSDRFDWFPFNAHKGWTVLIAVGVVCAAILVMLVWGLVCVLLRRRFQFSFRSLLMFLVALSVPLGWFAWEMEKARRQREAVEAIVGKGGGVAYDYEYDENGKRIRNSELTTPEWLRKLLGDDFFCEVVSVECQGTAVGDNDAIHLKGLTKLNLLGLNGTQITDSGLAHLEGLTELEILNLANTQTSDSGLARLEGLTKLNLLALDGTQISDSGLAHLEGLTKLETLSLDGTQITDSGLAHLEGLTKLETLSLDDTQISDSGLAHFEGLTKLDGLFLGYTQISDSALAHLEGLTTLEYLSLDGTQVTDKGVKKLQQSLPNCTIHHEPHHP